MCAGDYISGADRSLEKTELKEIKSLAWPVGEQFNNVGRTDAAKRYPDVVKVKKHFKTSGQNVLILAVGQQTFLMPEREAELIYQRVGVNRPEIF